MLFYFFANDFTECCEPQEIKSDKAEDRMPNKYMRLIIAISIYSDSSESVSGSDS